MAETGPAAGASPPRPDFASGLLTAIAQDATSGRVLMVAHMTEEAYDETLRSGFATFWSRSRGRLWRKGEQSGNTMRVREVRLDCDRDSVLLLVDAAGPACHTGETTCFFTQVSPVEVPGAEMPGGEPAG